VILIIVCIFATASPTQPAPAELPQGGNAARVGGRSGVMWVACHFLFPLFSTFILVKFSLIRI